MAWRDRHDRGMLRRDDAEAEQRVLEPLTADPVDGIEAARASAEDQEAVDAILGAPCEARARSPRGPSTITKSLAKAEALLRSRSNPGLGQLLAQKPGDRDSDTENEDSFVACRNLGTLSLHGLQRVEQSMLGLSQQYQVVQEPGWGTRGCVKDSALDGEFYHHPTAAAVSWHYGQLHSLLGQRAQLLFLHEYARRSAVATSFVASLASLLEEEWPPPSAETRGPESSVGALCKELRLHVGHWEFLCAKARSDRWLRRSSFRWAPAFATMRRSLRVLSLQALVLLERYISKALCAVAHSDPAHLAVEVLEDLLLGTKAFNQILKEQQLHLRASQWKSPPTYLLDQTGEAAARPSEDSLPMLFPLAKVLGVLSEHRARLAAEELHRWLANQSHFLSAFGCPVPPPLTWDSHFSSLRWSRDPAGPAGETSPSSPETKETTQGSPAHPLAAFVRQDTNFREKLLLSLVSSANLLVSRVPNRPKPDQPSTESCSINEDRQDRRQMDTRKWKCVQWRDMGKMDACMALLSQYEDTLWREFSTALLAHLYYPRKNTLLGSLNHCRDWMVFQVVKELRGSCRSDSIPVGYERATTDICTQIVARTAFMHWDEVTCASLGTGLKDRCFPSAGPAARTSTTVLLLQLFYPLSTVLGSLEPLVSAPHTDPDPGIRDPWNLRLLHLGSLCRAVATVHSATFWVVSKGHQFLSSWSVNKFLLVTQGDLKLLMAAAERLLQQAEALPLHVGGGATPVQRQAALLSQAAAALQSLSPMFLKIFSKDCKRMSMEMFEQTMPSGKQWRVSYRRELPASPSEYAASAARAVVGPVLEGVQPLPEELGVPAVSEATTAFMEAWMEHILREKIKFSLQGALQLKQDFDLVRNLLRSEEYGLSEEIRQRLLSLRVFYQVDSALVCLLQQPAAKPYPTRRGWEPFYRCCPHWSHSVDVATGSLNSLESMEVDIQAVRSRALTNAEGSLVPHLPSTSPSESYLAASQQEWLALRLTGGSRWRIPVLHCMKTTDP